MSRRGVGIDDRTDNEVINVRRARAGEAETVAALQSRVRDDSWDVETWRRELGRPQTAVWLAEGDRSVAPVASLAMWRIFDRLEILDLVVDSDYRRQGIATGLLESAIAIGALRGIRRIELEVRGDNRAAIELYRQVGFRFADRLAEGVGEGESTRRSMVYAMVGDDAQS